MLFTTLDEIKQFLPAKASFDLKDILPFIEAAEEDDIIPFLSQEQYDDLLAAYEGSGPLETDNSKLLKKVRRPLANIAYYNFVPVGNVSIGSGNISVAKPEGMEIASQWRIRDLENTFVKSYYKGIENLLIYLESKKDVFDKWAGSDAFTEFTDGFIKTATEFSKHFSIGNSRMIFLQMKGIMVQQELDHIKAVIGSALFDTIKNEFAAGDISTENKALFQFINPCVANFTGAAAIQRLPVKWTSQGIQLLGTSENPDNADIAAAASSGVLESLRTASLEEAQKQKKNLADYLYKNHATYPLYEADETVYKSVSKNSVNDEDRGIVFFG